MSSNPEPKLASWARLRNIAWIMRLWAWKAMPWLAASSQITLRALLVAPEHWLVPLCQLRVPPRVGE